MVTFTSYGALQPTLVVGKLAFLSLDQVLLLAVHACSCDKASDI